MKRQLRVRLGLLLTVAVSVAACAGGDPEIATNASAARSLGTLKVLVDRRDAAAEKALRARGAVAGEVDYGTFKMLLVDEQIAGGRAAVTQMGLDIRDDMNVVPVGSWQLDTRRAADTEAKLPAGLRRHELAAAKAQRRTLRDGLYLVQFVGPVRDAWLADLAADGLEVVSYMPENAYVVRARGKAAGKLLDLEARRPQVQWVGDYHPAYRLDDALLVPWAKGNADILVQVVDGPDIDADLADLSSLAVGWIDEQSVLNYRNVELTVERSRIYEIASREYVFHIEERPHRLRLDEAQGQILAGNLTLSTGQPTGPGYLAWLDSKGFSAAQFGGFVVNVADDAYTLNGHPDLPAGRVSFNNNPTNQTGVMGGHGFLNANIIAGYNVGIGSPFEDAAGYNFGLGVAPYARVGATAIFGNGSASSTTYEGTAYGQGSRISTNSWGYVDSQQRPIPKYDAAAQEYDRIVRDTQTAAGAQQLVVVFSAGNAGSAANTVGTPGTAKNVITVGAGENVRAGGDGCGIAVTGANNANDVISFSSRGPVNSAGGDGRIKPDIMAPGTHIEAGIPQSNYDGSSVCDKYFPAGQTLYGWSSGTSHSCPAVAGGAALVYQDFLNKNRPAPSPAMVKAYLMNSATHMIGVGGNDKLPSNNQGMGRMDLSRAFDTTSRVLVDQTEVLSNTGATYTVSGNVESSAQPFRVTVAWSDAPGPTSGAPWINNLDLEVTVGGVTYKGNVFTLSTSAAGGTADAKNNVESVFLPAGVSGPFTVVVKATNIAGDGVPGVGDTTDQDFALVVYNGYVQAPQPPAIGASPSSLSFSGTAGGANPANQALNLSNTGGGTLVWSASSDAAWLAVTPAGGTAPSAPSVSANTTGLAAGVYNGSVTLSAAGASPVVVPVTLTVNEPAPPAIGASPASLSFSGTAGGANPANQNLSISNTGGGTLTWSASSDAAWLAVAPAAGTAPSTSAVSVNTAGLAVGSYSGNITVSGAGASPVVVPVSLVVNAAPPPVIGVSPTSLSFSGTAGGANPANQNLAINNTGSGTLTWSAASDASWLAVAPAGGTAPSTSAVSVNTTGLAAGSYSGSITVSGAGASPVVVPVTLTVNAPQPPVIGVSPTSLSFSATAGGANPAGKSLSISNTGAGTLTWSASANAAWLGVSPAGGTAPSTASVSVNTTGLAAGSYSGAITVNGVGATPVVVPVTLTVAPSELVVNGGFEVSLTPWVTSGSATRSTSFPHTGASTSQLAAGALQSAQEYQAVAIPAGAAAANLTFWLNVDSQENSASQQNDKIFVEVRNASGTLLATLATFSNINKTAAGVYVQRGPYNLLPWKGQTVRVQFRSTANLTKPTTFRVDDVSIH